MAHGFVYALSNPSMPGICKIGFTTKHPRIRMAELSRATSCPTPFELLGYFGSACPEFAEKNIHASLAEFRVNNMREFFRCPFYEIQDQFRQWGDPSTDCFYTTELDFLADKEMMMIDEALGIKPGSHGGEP